MKNITLIKFALLAALPLAAPAQAADKLIFGEDDRVEAYAVPERYREAADSTVSLWRKNNMRLNTDFGTYSLFTFNLGEANGLCPGTRFSEQQAGAFCSGALVAEDLVITAGHCVKTAQDCANTAFVFGFGIGAENGNAKTDIEAGEVYGCARIIKRNNTSYTVTTDGQTTTIPGPDYALIKLDHKVTGHKPLAVNRNGSPRQGDSLFVTGHPMGLPLKFAGDARVVRPVNPEKAYFHTDLDVMGGNSGSPVFNADTGLIEGIHVRSEDYHFIPTFEGCNTYLVRPAGVGMGGEATKISFLTSYIPPTPQEAAAQAGAETAVAQLRAGLPPLGKSIHFGE